MGAGQSYRLPYCRTNTKKFPFFKIQSFFSSLDNEVIKKPVIGGGFL